MNEEKVAIIIFAQTGKQESLSKHIGLDGNGDEMLFDLLNKNIEDLVITTQIPYFFISEINQVGNCFGEKITNAVLSVFSRGYSNVIVLGNDCPQLKAKHIRNAFIALGENKEVIGRDNGGGAYLIGLTKLNFDSKAFQTLNWQTNRLFAGLFHLLNTGNNIAILPVLYNLNTRAEAKHLLKLLSFTSSFRKQILLILCIFPSKIQGFEQICSSILFFYTQGLRGPPIFVL